MSADQVSSVKKPDVPVPAAGQGGDASATAGQARDAGTAAGVEGQPGALARQPATGLTRQDLAAAVLAGSPGRPREAPGGRASIPDHQQAGKAARTPPEHGEPVRQDAGTAAGAKRQDGGSARQPSQGETRGRAEYNETRHVAPIQRHDAADQAAVADRTRQRPEPASPNHGPAMVPERAEQQGKHGTGTRHLDVPARTEHPGQPGSRRDVAVPDPQATRAADSAVASRTERAPRQEASKAGDSAPAPSAVGRSGDTAPGSAGSAGNSDNGHDLNQKQESRESKKVYVDGHEIEVTGNAADGIWVQGLPGEVPDKIGGVLAGPENTKRSRGDKFVHAAVEGADDLYDGAEKLTSLGYDALQHPPPTHAEVGVSSGLPTLEAQQHYAPDTGGIATGILTLGILGWAAGHRIHDWIDTRARRAHDASS
jgi:hypothetical protein